MKAAVTQGSVIFLKGCNYYVAFYRTKHFLLVVVFLTSRKTGSSEVAIKQRNL